MLPAPASAPVVLTARGRGRTGGCLAAYRAHLA